MDIKMWTDIILILAIVLNFASVCAIVPLGIMLYRSVLEAKKDLQMAAKLLKFSTRPIHGTYTPLAYYVIMAMLPLKEIQDYYVRAAQHRGGYALNVYGANDLSKKFISKYDSNFLKHGFNGEESFLNEPDIEPYEGSGASISSTGGSIQTDE